MLKQQIISNKYSLLGILVGCIALSIAFSQFLIADAINPPPEKNKIEKVIDTGLKFLSTKDPIKRVNPAIKNVRGAYMIVGFIGVVLSMLAFSYEEDFKLALTALGISITAIFWDLLSTL